MANQTKDTLKGYFNTGDIPSEANFQDLIDSSINQSETICQVLSGSLKTHITGSGTYGSGIVGTGDGYKVHTFEINNEKITTLVVDMQGISSSATINQIVGVSGSDNHLFQWSTPAHGLCYKVEMGCGETLSGGTTDIDVFATASAQATFATAGASEVIFQSQGNHVAGRSRSSLGEELAHIPTTGDYIYLTNGAFGTNGTYTTGKLIIKFYGICSDSY